MTSGRWGGRTSDRAGVRDSAPIQVVTRVTENIALDVVQFRPGDVVRNVQTGEEGVILEGSHGSRVKVQWESGRDSDADKENLEKVIGSREKSDPAEDASPRDFVGKTVSFRASGWSGRGSKMIYGKVLRVDENGTLSVRVKSGGRAVTVSVPGSQARLSSFNDECPFSRDEENDMTTDPPVSEAERRAMGAAMSGKSKLGIPKSVGKEFIDADPGGKLPARAHHK
jgi:hypothetical protein